MPFILIALDDSRELEGRGQAERFLNFCNVSFEHLMWIKPPVVLKIRRLFRNKANLKARLSGYFSLQALITSRY